MPEDQLELLLRRFTDIDGKLDQVEPGSPERDALLKEYVEVAKLIQADYSSGQTALDLTERRRIDEMFKKAQSRAEVRKFIAELVKATFPPTIAAGASIMGSLMLLRMRVGLEEEGKFIPGEAWKWAYNFVLKLKA